jgi:tRNA ligase
MKTLLIPVGIVGCNKTELGELLSSRISMAHVRNPDIGKAHQKKRFFAEAVQRALMESDVVFADRNNHLADHRAQLINLFRSNYPEGRIIVLDWRVDRYGEEELTDIVLENVTSRQSVYSSMQASDPKTLKIIDAFIRDYSPFQAYEGDCEVVEIGLEDDLETNVNRVLDAFFMVGL